MVFIEQKDLRSIREKYFNKKIVCCTGVFDLTHVGHILFFESCKKYGDFLVVSVANDKFVKSYKGNKRPVLNEFLRLKHVDSLKSVDYVVLDHNKKWEGKNSHKITLGSLFKDLKPDTYVMNNDALHPREREKIAKDLGVEIVKLPKQDYPIQYKDISTSNIIKKIKEVY